MKRGALFLLLSVVVSLALSVGGDPRPVHAGLDDQFMASESYYQLDVDAGTGTVRVEARVQPASNELRDVAFWAMPNGTDFEVFHNGEPLPVEVDTSFVEFEGAILVTATLATPLRGKLRTDLVMTYRLEPAQGDYVGLEPGAMEALFVSQGPGSFVLIDLPADADNYVDPGCVLAAQQPEPTGGRAYQRWVCGETVMVALNWDKPDVRAQCAQLDDRCRQRMLADPFAAFAQSITDESKRGVLQAPVAMADGSAVTLELLYFKRQEAWAQRQFEVAQQAFPLLEQVFGFSYPFDRLTMRQSHHIGVVGAAGIAFPTQGELLLATDTGFDEEVTIHELAHQWAGFNLASPWLWEGLAEYATTIVAGQLGIPLADRGWEQFGYTDPLSTWYNGSGIYNPDYWYGKSEAFWFAYEEALGGRDAMLQVLAAIDENPSAYPLDGRWFMDTAERITGVHLDDLFLEWVWVDITARPLIEERRAAWDLVEPLRQRAAALGLTGLPREIQQPLDDWKFGGTAGRVQAANDVLDDFEAVQQLAAEAGFPPVNVLAAIWHTSTMAQSASVVENQRQTIRAIVDAEEQLADEPADSPSVALLADARKAYANGDMAAAASLAAEAVGRVINVTAARRMVDLARQERDAFSPNLFTRVGLLFQDPEADLLAAEAALEAGDTATALSKSRAAYEAWDGAQSRGFKLLAFAAGVMATLSAVVWWLLMRLDRTVGRDDAASAAGHYLSEPDRTSWRDWEN
ncbi:MAG: hypothetical protein Kow0010_19110 [Dehalococcoidia bacterium]